MIARTLAAAAALALTGGCNWPPLGIDLSKRTPVPVDAEVDKVLTEWQQRRAGKKSFYATFKRTARDVMFKRERVNEGTLRYLHPSVGRMDIKANAEGEGRELVLATKDNEVWHFVVGDRNRLAVYELPPPRDETSKSTLTFEYLRGLPYVWFVPTDKTTLQKHGRIQKVSEDASQVVLRVKPVKPEDEQENGYTSLTIHLRKPDLLPAKLIFEENGDTEVTYEFTKVHENVEIAESDFVPPKIDLKEWDVTRQRVGPKPPANKAATNGAAALKQRPER